MVTRILLAVGLSLGVFAGLGVDGDDDAVTTGGFCDEGTIAPTRSCAKGEADFATSCCPDGYRPHGIAYADVANEDHAKAIAPVCRPIAGGEDTIPSAPSDAPIVLTCDKVEIMTGIACKDVPESDALDGCTAICTQPSTKNKRYIENPDIDDNDNPLRESATPKYHSRSKSKSRVLGVAFKKVEDADEQLDCAAISYKAEPIVK